MCIRDRQAQSIVSDRAQLIESANAQAQAIVKKAEERARVPVSYTHLDVYKRQEERHTGGVHITGFQRHSTAHIAAGFRRLLVQIDAAEHRCV